MSKKTPPAIKMTKSMTVTIPVLKYRSNKEKKRLEVHQFETQELTYLLVCSEADKERRSSSTQTPTHTGLMTGPLLPPFAAAP